MTFSNYLFSASIILALSSCDNKLDNKIKADNEVQSKELLDKNFIDNKSLNNAIAIGEDKKDLTAFVKSIYKEGDDSYVNLDFVDLKYKNVDERIIVNNNGKLRKYKIDSKTLIYLKNCKEIKSVDLHKFTSEILADSTQVVVGESKEGKLLSINFGCYD